MRLFFLVLSFSVLFAPTVRAAPCAPDRATLRGDWGEVALKVEVAADDQSRARGLMYRKSMARFNGMLFVYEKPQRAQFWMKNTFIPLDMLFVDKAGVVKTIHRNAVPQDLSVIDGGRGILAVIEVNAGTVATLGIDVGTQVQNPVFGKNAAWPCE